MKAGSLWRVRGPGHRCRPKQLDAECGIYKDIREEAVLSWSGGALALTGPGSDPESKLVGTYDEAGHLPALLVPLPLLQIDSSSQNRQGADR